MSDPQRETLDLTVVVPVFDELENIEPLVERVRATLDEHALTWEMVAVDDGSGDGSGQRLDRLAATEPRLRVFHFTNNNGQSAALDAGFRHARGELIATLDADLQVNFGYTTSVLGPGGTGGDDFAVADQLELLEVFAATPPALNFDGVTALCLDGSSKTRAIDGQAQ